MSKHDSSEQQNEATLNDVIIAIEKSQQYLEEIARWSKIEGYKKLKDVLDSAMDTPEKKIVYKLSDGKGTREINAICGISIGAISNYWNSWDRMGLMKKIKGTRGHDRFFKAFELEDYDIEVPQITQKVKTGEQKHSEQNETEQFSEIQEIRGDQDGK